MVSVAKYWGAAVFGTLVAVLSSITLRAERESHMPHMCSSTLFLLDIQLQYHRAFVQIEPKSVWRRLRRTFKGQDFACGWHPCLDWEQAIEQEWDSCPSIEHTRAPNGMTAKLIADVTAQTEGASYPKFHGTILNDTSQFESKMCWSTERVVRKFAIKM